MKNIIVNIFISVLLVTSVFSAIVSRGADDIIIDSTSSSQGGSVSSISWSHTVGNYDNRILVVCSGVEDSASNYIITGADYNNKALTKAYSEVVTSSNGYSASSEIWYILNQL